MDIVERMSEFWREDKRMTEAALETTAERLKQVIPSVSTQLVERRTRLRLSNIEITLKWRVLDMSMKCGSKAVPFELPDTADKARQLSDYAGRWLLLVFHRHLG